MMSDILFLCELLLTKGLELILGDSCLSVSDQQMAPSPAANFTPPNSIQNKHIIY